MSGRKKRRKEWKLMEVGAVELLCRANAPNKPGLLSPKTPFSTRSMNLEVLLKLGTSWHQVAEAKAKSCQRWMDSVAAARAIIALGQCTTILCDSDTKAFANQNGTRMRRMSLSKMESSTGHLWTSLL